MLSIDLIFFVLPFFPKDLFWEKFMYLGHLFSLKVRIFCLWKRFVIACNVIMTISVWKKFMPISVSLYGPRVTDILGESALNRGISPSQLHKSTTRSFVPKSVAVSWQKQTGPRIGSSTPTWHTVSSQWPPNDIWKKTFCCTRSNRLRSGCDNHRSPFVRVPSLANFCKSKGAVKPRTLRDLRGSITN